MYPPEGVVAKTTDKKANKLEKLINPTQEQIEEIRKLLGNDAFDYLKVMEAELLVRDIKPGSSQDSLSNFASEIYFVLRAKKRIVLCSGMAKIKEQNESDDSQWKALKIDFMYETDYIREHIHRDVPTQQGSTGEYLLKSNLVGDDPTSIGFLKNMLTLVKKIDTSCSIILSPTDSRRESIYRRALGDRENINIIPISPALSR